MIPTPDNEYCVVLDSCVLIPMPLCDILLRSAESPSLYCIAWSQQILDEIQKNLSGPKFNYTENQAGRRIKTMNEAFPDAFHDVPQDIIDSIVGLPDPNDRHVVALAIHAHASSIVTENLRDFPRSVLDPHHLAVISADEFLVNQFLLHPNSILEKLDAQAAGIRKDRKYILSLLKNKVPRFCELCS